MPALALPLSFTNSFWSQEYRRGLEILFSKLDQGIAENREIVHFIRARVAFENNAAASLINPTLTGPQGTGFDADDGASLRMTFLGLKQESIAQGEAHRTAARELETLVVDPFSIWAEQHAGRITETKKNMLDGWLKAYEQDVADVQKIKANYNAKSRRADEAEDDAKFAPNNDYEDHYTVTSPRVNQTNGVVKRTPSVSERISQRLKELRKGESSPAPEKALPPAAPEQGEAIEDEKPPVPKVDKGKGKAVDPMPESMPVAAPPPPPPPKINIPSSMMVSPDPQPILLAGVPMLPGAVSALLMRAEEELPLRPVRFPILGEYPDCFSGEEFAIWLKESVAGFGGNLARAEDAAVDLTEREGLLRRVGELGNQFENSRDAFYQFRPKAFELHIEPPSRTSSGDSTASPISQGLLKRSNTFANFVRKTIAAGTPSQPPHVKARIEADNADTQYQAAVRKLDRQRLGLEDEIERTLKNLQRWEADRLRAVKTVLLQYHGTLSNIPSALQPSLERSSTLIASYQPESDLIALMERYRTGPFRPSPHVYESAAHEGTDVVFGIDLRKWAGQAGWNEIRLLTVDGEEPEKKEKVPYVVSGLLEALKVAYPKLADATERRKTWIYEVPLPPVHYLREVINSISPHEPIPAEILAKYDAPVLASALKLWLLELDPPLCLWEGWEDIRKIYPSVGATTDRDEAQLMEDLKAALGHLPRIHLLVLDAIILHLKELIDNTADEKEDTDVYTTKLALSMGRNILRPKVEGEISIQDRHHTLLFIDLVKHYANILPPTIARKKRDSERPMPTRKRTALVDARLSRSSISGPGADTRKLLEAREAQIAEVARGPSPVPDTAKQAQLTSPPPPVEIVAAPSPGNNAAGRPHFIDPPDEVEIRESVVTKEPFVVSPPTPKPVSPTSPVAGSPPRNTSPPPDENKPLVSASSLSRTASGEGPAARTGVRGPRTLATKGPRPVSSALPSRPTFATHAPSRSSVSTVEAQGKVNPSDYAPRKRGGRVQAGAFSRRTMASGSEDEVVQN